jgi:uncharacterized protein
LNYKTQIREKRSSKEYCTWQEVEVLVEKLAYTMQMSHRKYDVVLAVTHGGIILARLIARELDVNHKQFIPIRNKESHAEDMLPLLKG